GWTLVKNTWIEGQDTTEESKSFDAERSLPDAFKAAMTRADNISDILKGCAEEAGRLTFYRAELEQITSRISDLRAQETDLKNKSTTIQDEWLALWSPLSIAARSPKEMDSWLNDHARLKEKIEAASAEKLKTKQLSDQVSQLGQRLIEALRKSQVEVDEGSELAVLAATARKLTEEHTEGQRRESERLKNIQRNKADFEAAQAGLAKSKDDLKAWQESWANVSKDYELLKGVSHEVMETILDRCSDIAESIKEIRGTNVRLTSVRQDMNNFAAKVKEVATRCIPDIAQEPPLILARELKNQLHTNRKNQTSSESLAKQIRERNEALRDSQEAAKSAKNRLSELIQKSQCQTIEELTQTEEKSARFRDLTNDKEKLEIQITSLGNGADLEALIEECESIEIDEAKAELEQREREDESLKTEMNETLQAIGEQRKSIEQLDSGPSAADALSRSKQSLARCRTLAEDYARLNLAIYLLETRMRAYEEESRGPIFESASEIFERITLGSFQGLDTEYDDHDRRIIVGKRSDGQSVGLDGFSDGSADQLYLALRIASLEQRLTTGPTLPFIVDDIFVHFDDNRTAATLSVLGELAQKTQVFLFTHHQSVSDSAQEVLGPDHCVVHQLNNRT
ncbi:MAG: hypothetical protein ACI97A_004383, partial [Planctomycetota bacterium]